MSRADVGFVLVHGAWHGGWCWEEVASRLRAAGFAVSTPTLAGAAERSAEMSSDVGLDTHIADVDRAIRSAPFERAVLVGHSYGGMVIEGACDRLRERIAHAVFLDGAAPRSGDRSFPDLGIEDLVALFGPLIEGYLLAPPMNLAPLGLIPGMAACDAARARLTPHPLRAWTDRLTLRHGGSNGIARTYIACTPKAVIRPRVAELRLDPSWNYREIVGGHDLMLTDPDGAARLLLDIALADTEAERTHAAS